ncbi:MAG: hypothetical protein LBN40_02075 [Oscillospiraceae bacterium]|nr:hypothetical protein [Oscillospiraceae bacterium]
MQHIIKYAANPIKIVSPEPFEIPFPVSFELMHENTVMIQYEIDEDMTVNYGYNPECTEHFPTPINRPLTIRDMYFLINSRVFPDETPFTEAELERFEIAEYDTYEIFKRTHGILPADKCWFRFADEKTLNYKKVMKVHRGYYERAFERFQEKQKQLFEEYRKLQQTLAPVAVEGVADILGQHEMKFGEMSEKAVGEPMTSEEFRKNVIGETETDEIDYSVSTPTGETMSDDDISAMFKSISLSNNDGEDMTKLSDDAIAAMFAQQASAAPETPTVVTPTAESNAKLGDDAIAAMFAIGRAHG